MKEIPTLTYISKVFFLTQNDLSDGPCFLSFQEVLMKEILPFFSLTIVNGK